MRKRLPKVFWRVSMLLLPTGSALACSSLDDRFDLAFLLPIFAVVLCSGAVMAVVWCIKHLFFRHRDDLSVVALSSLLLAVILGLLGTFGVPQFGEIYQSVGTELPIPTALVVEYRYLLWLPSIVMALSWRSVQKKATRDRYYWCGWVGATLLLYLLQWSLYLPVFKMGSGCW